MGKLCSKETQSDVKILVPLENEVSIPKYTSDGDKFYEKQEKKYNYLTKVLFQDYLYSLINFSSENSTLEDDYSNVKLDYSSNDAFYGESFSVDSYQSFIENKILKHRVLYDEAENNETTTTIFKSFLIETYNSLGQKLAQDVKSKGGEVADDKSIVTKGLLIPIAILHCAGPNYAKIRTIFNLFQEGGNLKQSEKLNNFLLALFLSAGYCQLHVRNKLQKYELVGGIEKNDLVDLKDTAELKDSQHLVEVTNKLIFGEDLSQSLDYGAFKVKFGDDNKDTSLGFMLSASGIRFMQKKHNV